MGLPDGQRCNVCGEYLMGHQCPVCDRSLQKWSIGETNNGTKFGGLDKTQIEFEQIRNRQISEYSGNLMDLDRQILACRWMAESMKDLTDEQKFAFAHLFNLANIGRYYLCVQLKETADLLRDSGIIKPGGDPWNLGEPKK